MSDYRSDLDPAAPCKLGRFEYDMARHCSIHGGFVQYMADEPWCDWSERGRRGDRIVWEKTTTGKIGRTVRGNGGGAE